MTWLDSLRQFILSDWNYAPFVFFTLMMVLFVIILWISRKRI